MSTRVKIIIGLLLTVVLVSGWLLFTKKNAEKKYSETPTQATTTQTEIPSTATTTPITTFGHSALGRAIESYSFGTGSTTLLFVGGVHGGYEWNSSALAYQFIAELTNGIFAVPLDIKVIVVPTLNPDGLYETTKLVGPFTDSDVITDNSLPKGTGRLNANQVDLNRNFDCKWKAESTWQSKIVSAGKSPFSEPESVALRDLVNKTKPVAVIFWHSQANTVYGSECHNGVLPETITLMNAYAKAANYKTMARFTAYPITGDAEGWLASLKIPAITVEMETHKTSEWKRNRAGISAVIDLYTKSNPN